jgi:ribokinase
MFKRGELMKKILVIGSTNMDITIRVPHIPAAGETLIGYSFEKNLGGKGANQAVAISKLGGRVSMISAVGRDEYGDQLLDNLQSTDVNISGIIKSDSDTGLAFIYVNDLGENCIAVLPGANYTIGINHIDEMRGWLEEADWVVLQMEIPESAVKYAVKTAHSINKKVLLNPAPAPDGKLDDIYNFIDIILRMKQNWAS